MPYNLAAQLLACATDPAVVLALAEFAETEVPLPLNATLSTADALALAERSLVLAQSVARSPEAPPAALAKLARTRQKSVRRCVAANPRAPAETLRYLAGWALKDGVDDEELLELLFATMDPTELLPLIRSHPTLGLKGWDGRERVALRDCATDVVNNLIRRHDADLIFATFDLGVAAVSLALLLAATDNKLPVTPGQLLARVPGGTFGPAATSVGDFLLSYARVFDDDVADYVASIDVTVRPLRPSLANEQKSGLPVSDYFIEKLSASPNIGVREWLANRSFWSAFVLPDAVVHRMTATANNTIADTFLRTPNVVARLTRAEILSLLAVGCTKAETADALFVTHAAGADIELATALLRAGNSELTFAWLTGQGAFAFSLDILDELIFDIGFALRPPRANPSNTDIVASANTDAPTSRADFISRFEHHFKVEHLKSATTQAVFNAAGPMVLKLATRVREAYKPDVATVSAFAHYAHQRLLDEFGPNPRVWSQLLTVARLDVPYETFDEFIGLVRGILITT